jgi:hypothetical protein
LLRLLLLFPTASPLCAPSVFMWDLRRSAITEFRLTSNALMVSLRRVSLRPSTGVPRQKGEIFRYLRLHSHSMNNRHCRNVIFPASGVVLKECLLFWHWLLLIEVLRQSISLILKGPVFQEDLVCWNLEGGNDMLSRNLGNKLPIKTEEHNFRNISVCLV